MKKLYLACFMLPFSEHTMLLQLMVSTMVGDCVTAWQGMHSKKPSTFITRLVDNCNNVENTAIPFVYLNMSLKLGLPCPICEKHKYICITTQNSDSIYFWFCSISMYLTKEISASTCLTKRLIYSLSWHLVKYYMCKVTGRGWACLQCSSLWFLIEQVLMKAQCCTQLSWTFTCQLLSLMLLSTDSFILA